ncbi:MAG: CBS domain-containing protein [Gammaproteobacteria bacterium]|nr:MAG: CBS domain-containing protein [Gammaproteobacteria bacterium]
MEELTYCLQRAEHRNLINPDTLTMIEGALRVARMQVDDIMVPLPDMVVVGRDERPEAFLPRVIESGHSRFPVVDEERRVVGLLLAKDLLAHLAAGEKEFRLRDIMRPPVFVPESKRLHILLREFRISRNHLAIVVDEYGNTAGLVSIEDVLEQIVGNIDDEHDTEPEEVPITSTGEGRYLVQARTEIEEFNRYFDASLPEEEFDTIGGLLLKAFGHLPRQGEKVRLGGFEFTVLQADQRRIHQLQVTRLKGRKAAAA